MEFGKITTTKSYTVSRKMNSYMSIIEGILSEKEK
jgi:hypothetical protein